jgi:hypothetical protein
MSDNQASKVAAQPAQQQQQASAEPARQMADAFDSKFKTIGISAVSAATTCAHMKQHGGNH